MKKLFYPPYREYVIIVLVIAGALLTAFLPFLRAVLMGVALVASLPTAWEGGRALLKKTISIDTFNSFALAVSFGTGEVYSAAFIVLMLAIARLLDWYTQEGTRNATEELLKLKPLTAKLALDDSIRDIPVDDVRLGDILAVGEGAHIPVDGMVVFGEAFVNESAVSGESDLIKKILGDHVMAGTLNESGTLKIRAVHSAKDSTVERMVALMKEAVKNKSHSEKLADQFAKIFLPFVLVCGVAVYFFTHNISMVAALFLVACADDMAVAIPLAMTAAIGNAAKRGVIIKGGAWLDTIGKVSTFVIDKTGTLTYGNFAVSNVSLEEGVEVQHFWRNVAIAEKFSEHPVGRALMSAALTHVKEMPDADEFNAYKGAGVRARWHGEDIAVGNEEIFKEIGLSLPPEANRRWQEERRARGGTTVAVLFNKKFVGWVSVEDVPRPEAKESIEALRHLGITNIVMFTGDDEATARRVAHAIGIQDVRASMKPADKLRALEELAKTGLVCMVGDGINDAPSLARADVGIAMGKGGTAVAVEAADIVVLTDNLSHIPEIVDLGRRTTKVIRGDMIIWLVSNIVGFALVLTGVAGPARAAFYNFFTDFFPLINSALLFRQRKTVVRENIH